MFTFRPGYFALFCLVLLSEIGIAARLSHGWLREHGGDTLALVLVYAALRTVIRASARCLLLTSLAIAYSVELLQLTQLAACPWFRDQPWLRIALGSHFDVADFVAYTLGVPLVVSFDCVRKRGLKSCLGRGESPRRALHRRGLSS